MTIANHARRSSFGRQLVISAAILVALQIGLPRPGAATYTTPRLVTGTYTSYDQYNRLGSNRRISNLYPSGQLIESYGNGYPYRQWFPSYRYTSNGYHVFYVTGSSGRFYMAFKPFYSSSGYVRGYFVMYNAGYGWGSYQTWYRY